MTKNIYPMDHPKVDELKQKRQAALNSLLYEGKPMFADDIMKQRTAAVEEEYDAALVMLMQLAEGQREHAAGILAEAVNPYEWLTKDEFAQAAALAPFVREDMQRLDAAGLETAVKQAGARGRVERWLVWRYAGHRAEDLDTSEETTLSISQAANFQKDINALQESVMLPSQVRERAKAAESLQDAETLYAAAGWGRQSTREEFAARMGLNPAYVE